MADNIKEYRLNDMFVIRCYLKPDDYKVEVLVDTGRFLETLEVFKTTDKNEANTEFKRLATKYKRCDDILID